MPSGQRSSRRYLHGQHKKGMSSVSINETRYITHSSRFPVISGFHVSWDSRRPPGQRVLGIWLLQDPAGSMSVSAASSPYHSGTTTPVGSSSTSLPQPIVNSASNPAPPLIDGEPIPRMKGGRIYRIVTREYMAQGHDGYEAFKGRHYIVDDESGQIMSGIVRKYLLGVFEFTSFSYFMCLLTYLS